MMIDQTELELVVVEVKSNREKIEELHKEIVESDFSEKLIQYINLSKRQDKILFKIKQRKS